MLSSFSPSQIERFKRDAKAQSKAAGISHSEALNRIALANHYDNWSLLMKRRMREDELEAAQNVQTFASIPLVFKRSVSEMREAIRAPKAPFPLESRFYDQEKLLVRNISQEFCSPLHVLEFAIDYMRSLLAVPRFQVSAKSLAWLEMRVWLPYQLHTVGNSLIFVNREYQPVGCPGYDLLIQNCHAAFPALKVHKPLELFTKSDAWFWPVSDNGFLHDGYSQAPWQSRQDAQDYLDVLCELKRRFLNLGVV